MHTSPQVWPSSTEDSKNFVNHFSGNRFCGNIYIWKEGGSASCITKYRTMVEVWNAKKEMMFSFQNENIPYRFSHIPFLAKECLVLSKSVQTLPMLTLPYGWINCIIEVVRKNKSKKLFSWNMLNGLSNQFLMKCLFSKHFRSISELNE